MTMLSLPSLAVFEQLYVFLSAWVAIAIWLQMRLLRKNNGKMPESSLFHALSFFDSIWILISAAALYFLEFKGLSVTVPVIYGVFTFLGFFDTARAIKNHGGMPEHPEDIVFDKRYLSFRNGFALVFFGLCVTVFLGYHLELPTLSAFL